MSRVMQLSTYCSSPEGEGGGEEVNHMHVVLLMVVQLLLTCMLVELAAWAAGLVSCRC